MSTPGRRRAGDAATMRRRLTFAIVGLVALRPDGALLTGSALPGGVTEAELRPGLLLEGQTVSSVNGSLAVAAVPIQLNAADLARAQAATSRVGRTLAREAAQGIVLVVVLTRQVPGQHHHQDDP